MNGARGKLSSFLRESLWCRPQSLRRLFFDENGYRIHIRCVHREVVRLVKLLNSEFQDWHDCGRKQTRLVRAKIGSLNAKLDEYSPVPVAHIFLFHQLFSDLFEGKHYLSRLRHSKTPLPMWRYPHALPVTQRTNLFSSSQLYH